jgi:mono/diheme cytochrome c family protein
MKRLFSTNGRMLPVVTLFAACFVSVSVAAPGVPGNTVVGKQLFLHGVSIYRCTGCHTLKAAGSFSYVGPNLDEVRPAYADIVSFITHGHAAVKPWTTIMPAASPPWTVKQIEDVAAFIYTATH